MQRNSLKKVGVGLLVMTIVMIAGCGGGGSSSGASSGTSGGTTGGAPVLVGGKGVVTTLAGLSGFLNTGSADGTGAAARFKLPEGVAVDASGNVYIADSSNSTIRKVTASGVVTTLAGTALATGNVDGIGATARFSFPSTLAVDTAGNLYVADGGNHTIRKVTASGVVTTIAGTAGVAGSVDGAGTAAKFNMPFGIAVDASGNLYVGDWGNNTIRKITAAGVVTTIAGTAGVVGSADGTGGAASFNAPAGVAVDLSGNIYVADSGNHTIRKISTSGVVTTFAGTAGVLGSMDGTGTSATFRLPRGVATDAAGNVYVANTTSHTIRKITPAGVVITVAGSAGTVGFADGIGYQAYFTNPQGIASDALGVLYVADTDNNSIRKIN